MPIGKLSRTARDRDDLHRAPPLAVIVEKVTDDHVLCGLLGDQNHGRGGMLVKVRGFDAPFQSYLDAAVRGNRRGEDVVHPTAPGDMLVFDHAVAGRDADGSPNASTGFPVVRVPCSVTGEVQVVKALVRPTRFSVSKRGMTQYVSIVEPRIATRVADEAGALALLDRAARASWPGGDARLLLRRDGRCEEVGRLMVGNRRETPAEFAARLGREGRFSGGPVEAMPAWSLPVGRTAQSRETPRLSEPTDAPRYGSVSSLYAPDGYVGGFRTSFVAVHEEEEWAFGARTGRRQRVAGGYYPVAGSAWMEPADVPGAQDPKAAAGLSMRFLFDDPVAMRRSVERRTAARSEFESRVGYVPPPPAAPAAGFSDGPPEDETHRPAPGIAGLFRR